MACPNKLGADHVNSVPTTPTVEVRSKFQDCEETFLDEEGWKAEAAGVIKDVQKYVKEVYVSHILPSSRNNIYMNLITKEDNKFTVELTSEGFKVVGLAYDTLNPEETAACDIYETPYSLLDNISPAYRQAFGDDLTNELLKLQAGGEAGMKPVVVLASERDDDQDDQ